MYILSFSFVLWRIYFVPLQQIKIHKIRMYPALKKKYTWTWKILNKVLNRTSCHELQKLVSLLIFHPHWKENRFSFNDRVIKITEIFHFLFLVSKVENTDTDWKSKFNGMLGAFCVLLVLTGCLVAYLLTLTR